MLWQVKVWKQHLQAPSTGQLGPAPMSVAKLLIKAPGVARNVTISWTRSRFKGVCAIQPNMRKSLATMCIFIVLNFTSWSCSFQLMILLLRSLSLRSSFELSRCKLDQGACPYRTASQRESLPRRRPETTTILGLLSSGVIDPLHPYHQQLPQVPVIGTSNRIVLWSGRV